MNLSVPLVVGLLLAVNALYVAAEFAAVSVRKSRVERLAQDGNRLASVLLPAIKNPTTLDRYVAACQIGITLSSLLLGAYGQAAIPQHVAPLLEVLGAFQGAGAVAVAAIIVLLFLTAVQVIIGELVPKSLALQYPTQVALYTALPMRWSMVALRPFIAFLNGSGILLLKLFRVPATRHNHVHSPDEIELLILQSASGGLLTGGERRRLRRALQIEERAVRQVMVPRPSIMAIDVDIPPGELVERVSDSPYTRLPVYRETIDNCIGILHAKDLAAALFEHGGPPPLTDLMRPVLMVPESITVERLLTTFREKHAVLALVLDEYGGTAGLVTLEDVLSELFGPMGDEFKAQQRGPERLPDGRVRLPGTTSVQDAGQWIGDGWETEADTVGGLVMERLGHVPEAGETVRLGDVGIEVEAVAHHAATSLLVGPAATAEPAGEDG